MAKLYDENFVTAIRYVAGPDYEDKAIKNARIYLEKTHQPPSAFAEDYTKDLWPGINRIADSAAEKIKKDSTEQGALIKTYDTLAIKNIISTQLDENAFNAVAKVGDANIWQVMRQLILHKLDPEKNKNDGHDAFKDSATQALWSGSNQDWFERKGTDALEKGAIKGLVTISKDIIGMENTAQQTIIELFSPLSTPSPPPSTNGKIYP